ncbi:MAG: hypothetical protein JW844_06030 [Candidatus Omnitrophica bacterium]|nr:hypothetical protein [Candidatus Omnitrophota bacterium]
MGKASCKKQPPLSSSEICLKIISEIQKRLIDPLTVIHEIAKEEEGADRIMPLIIDDFANASVRLWEDIKKSLGPAQKKGQ